MFICCQHVNRILSSRRHIWILASQHFYLLVDPKSCPNWFPLHISAPFLNFSLMALLSPGHSHCGCKAVPQVVAVAIKGGRMARVTPPTPEVSLSFTLKSLSHYHFTEWFKSIYILKEHQGSHHLSVCNRPSLRSISQNKVFLDFRSMFLSWAHKFFEESDFTKYWFYVWYSGYYANGTLPQFVIISAWHYDNAFPR